MAGRAMWKAKLVIGSAAMPIRLYAAVEDRGLHLHLLHRADGERVRQRLVDPTGRTVEPGETRRGVEVERGRFVVLDADELAALEPPPSRDIDVQRFVKEGVIPARRYDRPYYLGPDAGREAEHSALAAALARSGRVGVARWTMRKRDYCGALRVHRGRLALVTLFEASALVAAAELRPPAGRDFEARERQLAQQLVEALAGPFEHEQFTDAYRDRVLELVAKKRRGERVETTVPDRRATADRSLVKALEQSLQRAS